MKHIDYITVLPINTKDNLVTLKFKLDRGLITETGFYFPAGCHGRVYLRMLLDAHQIFPRDPNTWASGDDGWAIGQTYFPVTASPAQIVVEAYADGVIWQHKITIAVEVKPWQVVEQWSTLIDFITALGEELGIWEPSVEPTEMTP